MPSPVEFLRFRHLLEEAAGLRGVTRRMFRRALAPARASAARIEDAGMRRSEGGSGIWLSITIVIWTVRVLARISRRRRQRVYAVQLQPGQQLQVRHLALDRAGRAVRAEA
jgi:hypothetical protein